MKLRETKWENQTEPKSGMRCSVRARPLRGLAGRLSRPTWATQNKQSDCPQNPAHLTPASNTSRPRRPNAVPVPSDFSKESE